MNLKHGTIALGSDNEPLVARWTVFRIGWWQLTLECWFRKDPDPDLHDHAWDHWILPLTTYLEQVPDFELPDKDVRRVKRWRIHKRKAEEPHRMLQAAVGPDRPIWLLCFHGPKTRRWGYHRESVVSSGDGKRQWPMVVWTDAEQYLTMRRVQQGIAEDLDLLPDWEESA